MNLNEKVCKNMKEFIFNPISIIYRKNLEYLYKPASPNNIFLSIFLYKVLNCYTSTIHRLPLPQPKNNNNNNNNVSN